MAYSIEQRDEQLVGAQAAIRYTLSFARRAQHLLDVAIEIDTDADELTLVMPNWLPGSYKVRDFVSHQGDFAVRSELGEPLAFEWLTKNRVRVITGGTNTVRVAYCCYGFERSVRLTHVSRFHAFVNPGNCLMFVEGRSEEIHLVTLDHPWSRVSTALSPVRSGVYGALNYDILVDSPIEIGDHYVAEFERHGARHEVAITGVGDFDPDWITEQIKLIVDRAVAMWGALPYDRYVFINQMLPGLYGGLEHARCSVNMYDAEIFADKDKTVKFLSLLCHEYFHLWNVKRIRPIELGPFDYDTENYTRMLWLAEGCTSYYDVLMTYRCGFVSRPEYLRTLTQEHLGRLLDVPGRLALSIKDSSFLSWVKLYIPTPDSHNRTPSYYLKGGVIFLLLDMMIITQSNGERSLDDGMRALMRRYRENPSVGLTEEEFVRIVGEATGVDIGPQFLGWLNSTDELPITAIVDGMGLQWRPKPKQENNRFGADLPFQPPVPDGWIGIHVEEAKHGLKIGKVWRDSPAEAAGLGAEDELIAINGVRVTSVKQWEAIVRHGLRAGALRVTAVSEGKLYETEIDPRTRESYELIEKGEMTEVERKRLDRWLAR